MVKLIVVKNPKEGSERASHIIIESIKKNPSLVLGLATGNTMIPLYKTLVKLYEKRKIDFSKIRCFNLDEYIGLNEEDKESFRHFMNLNLFNKININKENIHFLDGKSKDFKVECKNYEKEIKKCNGIDLQILGIGKNGHIGLNEPGSSFKSRTRKVRLSYITRKANKKFFSKKEVPKEALTMGLATITEARKILLLAFGKEKAKAVYSTLYENITKKLPASILKKHKNVIFIVDKNAAVFLVKNKNGKNKNKA